MLEGKDTYPLRCGGRSAADLSPCVTAASGLDQQIGDIAKLDGSGVSRLYDDPLFAGAFPASIGFEPV